MGNLWSVISPFIFGIVDFLIPGWRTQLCGVLTDFAPIDVCDCILDPSQTDFLAVDFSLDCAKGERELQQCIGFSLGDITPFEFCVDCDFDLDGSASLIGLSGSVDGEFQCTYSLTVLDFEVLPFDKINAGLEASVDLENGVKITDCGSVVASKNGNSVFGCTCQQEDCGENQLKLSCDLQFPVIGPFDLNTFINLNALPLLGECFDVPDPFDVLRREYDPN